VKIALRDNVPLTSRPPYLEHISGALSFSSLFFS
jgi:hypothetical protein